MSANTALEANANAAGPASDGPPQTSAAGSAPRRVLNIQQSTLVDEFVRAYDISPEQIIFDGENTSPFFHYEALAQIVAALSNFAAVNIQEPEINYTHRHVTCQATITLHDGRVFGSPGAAWLDEALPGGEKVESYLTATDVARARALRSALRLVGFDPVRAHEARKRGERGDEPPADPEAEQRRRELAEIHILAQEAGLIRGEDKSAYYRQLRVFFPSVSSSSELAAPERAQFLALLRGIKSARTRSEASDK